MAVGTSANAEDQRLSVDFRALRPVPPGALTCVPDSAAALPWPAVCNSTRIYPKSQRDPCASTRAHRTLLGMAWLPKLRHGASRRPHIYWIVSHWLQAPVTEEVTYRACVLSFYNIAGASRSSMVWTAPCWFGLGAFIMDLLTY